MDLALTDDQRAILDALDSLVRPFEDAPLHDASFAATSAELDRNLRQGGFLDVAADPDLGTVTAAIVAERIARLPYSTEAAANALVGPLFDDVSGPICLVNGNRTPRLVRFLAPGVTVVVLSDGGSVRFTAHAHQIEAEPDALYGYPVATLKQIPIDASGLDCSPEDVRIRWRVALAAETAGLLRGALSSTVRHLSEREQFGRKLATFQALRHRLAEAEVRTNGVYWLAMKAAATLNPADAALAATHAQESARQSVYDFHQFLGAMGMTLEHPLHLWTYRLKALMSELGGRGANAVAAADSLWPR